jgi:hypothetical protein
MPASSDSIFQKKTKDLRAESIKWIAPYRVVLSDILTPDSFDRRRLQRIEPNGARVFEMPSALVRQVSFVVCGFLVDFRNDPTYDGAVSLWQARFAEFRGPNR